MHQPPPDNLQLPPKAMPRSYMIPKKFVPKSDNGYFEVLSKTVFQVGFNWRVVEKKWPDIHKAFHGFRIELVAKMDIDDVDALLKNKQIIRNGRKIMAVIANAQKFLEIKKKHAAVKKFLRSLRKKPYRERRKILSKMFAGIGPTGVFVFLYTVDEPVPHWHQRND